MDSITLTQIVAIVMADLSNMLKKNKLDYNYKLFSDTDDSKVEISIGLKKNNLNGNFHDASIIVDNYTHKINDIQHNVKLSIFASQCLMSGELANKPPDKEIEIHEILPSDGSGSILDYPTIAKTEEEFSSTICSSWNSNLS